LLATLLILLAVASWFVSWDDSWPGTGILGGYSNRWFSVNLSLSYAALIAALAVTLHPSRQTVFKIATLHLGAFLPFVVLELAALLGWVDFAKMLPPDPLASGVVDPRLRRQTKPYAHFAGEVRPDLEEVLGAEANAIQADYQMDRFGLRNPYDKNDPAVFFLGDSVLVGVMIPVQKIVSERVEAKLGLTVINVSEVGYSPQEELARLESTGIDLRDRLVVQFFFAGNDVQDSSRWRDWRGRFLKSNWPDTSLLKAVLNMLHRPHRAAGGRRTGLFRSNDGSRIPIYFFYQDAGWKAESGELEELKRVFREARRDIEARGGRYAMAFIPIKLAVLRPYCTFPPGSVIANVSRDTSLVDGLHAFCAQEGIPFLDLQPALERVAASGTLPYFAADTHPNEAGHEAMAEALVPWLRCSRSHSGPQRPCSRSEHPRGQQCVGRRMRNDRITDLAAAVEHEGVSSAREGARE
jgi:hypothetical protein